MFAKKPSKECENALKRLEEKFEQVVKKCAKIHNVMRDWL